MALVGDDKIGAFLKTHPSWSRDNDSIRRQFEFADFGEAMAFVTRVGLASEKADHHPDIGISWNKVDLTLSTHSAGGLTVKDLDLAAKFDGIASGT
jgi:4a-hydroxytetrahydrobiopterin dehydratase